MTILAAVTSKGETAPEQDAPGALYERIRS